jgi:predicted DNA-binding transcriptional regulator YafY
MRKKLALLRDGIHHHRVARMRYTRADGESSKRAVRPLGLFYWGNSWTLGAWCEYRKDFRNFRLDRMGEVTLLKRTYKPESGQTLDDYLAAMEEG